MALAPERRDPIKRAAVAAPDPRAHRRDRAARLAPGRAEIGTGLRRDAADPRTRRPVAPGRLVGQAQEAGMSRSLSVTCDPRQRPFRAPGSSPRRHSYRLAMRRRRAGRLRGFPMSGIGASPPLLMRRDEVVSIKRAAAHAGRSVDTVRRWYHDHGIGRQAGPSAPVEISIVGLEMVMHGDWPALDALRAGDRSSPLVSRYFEFLGLPA